MHPSEQLAPIEGLEFFEDIHRYRYQGRWLPFSVSQIASPPTPEMQQRFDETRHIWEPRGNQVHGFLEAYLNSGVLEETDYPEWTEPLSDCWLVRDGRTIATEYSVCDPRKGVGGSFDFLLESSNGKIVLGDLKTVNSEPAVSTRKPAKAQLGGYLAMLIDMRPDIRVDWCYTVVAGPGRCRLIQNEPDECLMAWVDAWDRFKVIANVF